MANRQSFTDFLRGLLQLNPLERWSPQQAKLHPFITGEKWTGPYNPTAPSSPKLKRKNAEYPVDAFEDKPRYARPRANTIASVSSFLPPPQLQRLVGNMVKNKDRNMQHPGGKLGRNADNSSDEHLDMDMDENFHEECPDAEPRETLDGLSGDFAGLGVDIPHSHQSQAQTQNTYHQQQHQYSASYGAVHPGSQHLPSGHGTTPPYQLRKARSSSISFGMPLADHWHMQQQQHQQSGSYGSTHMLNEGHGHPRHGERGERCHLPSRAPSAATSDWEMFDDIEAGKRNSISGAAGAPRGGGGHDDMIRGGSFQGTPPKMNFFPMGGYGRRASVPNVNMGMMGTGMGIGIGRPPQYMGGYGPGGQQEQGYGQEQRQGHAHDDLEMGPPDGAGNDMEGAEVYDVYTGQSYQKTRERLPYAPRNDGGNVDHGAFGVTPNQGGFSDMHGQSGPGMYAMPGSFPGYSGPSNLNSMPPQMAAGYHGIPYSGSFPNEASQAQIESHRRHSIASTGYDSQSPNASSPSNSRRSSTTHQGYPHPQQHPQQHPINSRRGSTSSFDPHQYHQHQQMQMMTQMFVGMYQPNHPLTGMGPGPGPANAGGNNPMAAIPRNRSFETHDGLSPSGPQSSKIRSPQNPDGSSMSKPSSK